MCSTPPATTMSAAPSPISPAPDVTAVSAPANIRSSANPGTVWGMPASSATSRTSVSPWSPTCAVAAKITSPMRSGGIPGLRRSSSRTTFTAMSSARVRQNIPFGPARPNAVRTPSTKTTSRSARDIDSSLRRGFCALLEPASQILQLPAVGDKRLSVELDQDDAAGRHELAVAARVEEPPVRIEAVTGSVDRIVRLAVVGGIVQRVRQVRPGRHDDVDADRHGVEQVAFEHVQALGDGVQLRVRARQLDRVGIPVDGPDLDLWLVDGERDRDRSRSRSDVGDALAPLADRVERPTDERLGRRAR